MADRHGLLYIKELLLGFDEMQWLQAEYHERQRLRNQARMRQPGLVIPQSSDGTLGDFWRVHDDDDDGIATILGNDVVMAIDELGYEIVMTDDRTGAAGGFVDVPDDNTWYTIVLRRTTSKVARGTIDLSVGSATIVGTDTEFTRFTGKTSGGYSRGTTIYIDPADSSSGNGGYYELDTVTDDTNAAFTAAIPGGSESNVPFAVAGQFAITPPSDRRIQQRIVPEFERVAQLLEPSNDDLVICDIKRNSAATPEMQIRDRRKMNLWRAREAGINSNGDGCRFTLPAQFDEDSGSIVVDLANAIVDTSGSGFGFCDIAHGNYTLGFGPPNPLYIEPSLVAVYDEGSQVWAARKTTGYTEGQEGSAWSTPVSISGAGGGNGCTIELVEGTDPDSPRHIVVFSDGTDLYKSTSDDNGATWTAPVAIWTAGGSNQVAGPHMLLLRNGRLVVTAAHYDGTTNYSIRLIYSDDFGATWQTNAAAGWTIQGSITTPTSRAYLAESPDREYLAVAFVETSGTDYNRIFITEDSTALSGWSEVAAFSDTDIGAAPALYFAPNNQLACIYSSSSAEPVVQAAWLGYNEPADVWRIVDYQRVFQHQTGATPPLGGFDVFPALCPTMNGGLEMIWRQEAATDLISTNPLRVNYSPRATFPYRQPATP